MAGAETEWNQEVQSLDKIQGKWESSSTPKKELLKLTAKKDENTPPKSEIYEKYILCLLMP